ncbi:fasciclin domain-containing protein [Rhodanobacter umsongensis]
MAVKIARLLRACIIGLSLAAAMTPLVVAGKTKKTDTSDMIRIAAPKAAPDNEASMSPSKNIVQNVDGAKDLITLAAAMKAAKLADTLAGAGPYTLFAPRDKAFAALPADAHDRLLKPGNEAALARDLGYHVVPGRLTTKDLAKAVEAGGGTATLKTLEGDSIIISKDADRWAISDDKGNVAHVTVADLAQSNGVIMVIDQVLMP